MKTLKQAKVGETVKVVKLTGQGAVKRRIMDMGITKGVEIFIRKVAPLGDPVEVTVRGYELSLRKDDASMIEVEEIFFDYRLANTNYRQNEQTKIRRLKHGSKNCSRRKPELRKNNTVQCLNRCQSVCW